MKVRIRDLARAIDGALAQLEKTSGPDVELSDDPYWSVADGSLFDVEREPKELTIGSLVEELDAKDPSSSHALRHASGILRALAVRR